MEEKENATIPYFVHESTLARMERTIKRLFVLCIVLIAVAVCSNLAWLYYESLFEEVTSTEIEQDAEWDSGNVIMNGTGEVNSYGESKTGDTNN